MSPKPAHKLDEDNAVTAVVQTSLPADLDHLQHRSSESDAPPQSSVIHPGTGANAHAERYKAEAELGRGGMGRVMKVFDRDLNRAVAMKLLINEGRTKADVEQFLSEAQINSQLEHANMVPVHDIGLSDEGEVYFTMRMVRGHRTLRDVIWQLQQGDPETHARYSFERRVQLVQQLCHAFQYAHQRGVIHCDIKPSNIVVGDCGELFIVDWGIAVLSGEADREHPHGRVSTSSESGKAVGAISGTLKYIAPERLIRGRALTARADIFSLCAVLYELLCLNHYLDKRAEAASVELLGHIVTGVRVPAEHYYDPHNGRVPRSLSRICAWGLRTDPMFRFESMASLNQALQDWVEGRVPMVCPGTTIQRGLAGASRVIDRRPILAPTVIIVVMVAVLILVVAGLISLFS